jgi:hypothetical protein
MPHSQISTMTNECIVSQPRFLSKWVLLTLAGWLVGFPVAFILASLVSGMFGNDSVVGRYGLDNAAVFVGVTAMVGLMQWLALRRLISGAGSWVLATIVGFAIPAVIHGVVCHTMGYPDDLGPAGGTAAWVVAFVIGGALAGFMQHRILRTHVLNSTRWVWASAAGWGLSIGALGIAAAAMPEHHASSAPVAFLRFLAVPIAGAVLLGLVTGGTLLGLLRHRID